MSIQLMNPQELGYLAGIVDGEGCITISGLSTPWPQPYLQVGQLHEGLIDWCIQKTGLGKKYLAKYRSQELFKWHVHKKEEVFLVLTAIAPLLIVKKLHAECALVLLRAPYSDERTELCHELMSLNGKGHTSCKDNSEVS